MGIFGKIKSFFGFTGVKIEFTKVESPFPIGDSVFKANYEVKAGSDVTIKELKHLLIAKRSVKNGDKTEEETILLGEESSNDFNDVDVQFPYPVKAGETFKYGMCMIRLDFKKSLAKWGVQDANTANIQGVKFVVKVEVDILETAFTFDPDAEAEFVVQ